MRLTIFTLLPLASALQLPNFSDFLAALPIGIDDYIRPNNTDSPPTHDLLRRQFSNTCPTNFHACNNLGAPGLCCAEQAVCSADANGNVACCPIGAECSGTINGVITKGTVNQDGSIIPATGSRASFGAGGGSATTTQALVPANTVQSTVAAGSSYQGGTGTNTGGGFIIDGTSTVASPGRAGRVEMPLFARAIIKALQYLPI